MPRSGAASEPDDLAAVDRDDVTGHPGALWSEQEQKRADEVFGLTHPLQLERGHQRIDELLRNHHSGGFSVRRSGCNGIDANASRAESAARQTVRLFNAALLTE